MLARKQKIMSQVRKVAVIGGGIIGTSSALLILRTLPNVEVTLISDKFSPFTTGDGSAGFWKPYLLGGVSDERLKFWCMKTYKFFQDIAISPNANEYGVGLLPSYELSESSPLEKPPYSDALIEWRPMNSKEMSMFPKRFKYGAFMMTFFIECNKLLPLFCKEIIARNGKILRQKVESLSEFIGKYNVVINCCGLGAAQLVPDPHMIPIRGQVIRIKAHWIKYAVMNEEFYILPNCEETICGGTHQVGDWSTEVDADDRKKIWKGCTELIPSLKNAEILRDWVGLRPGRFEPRLERDHLKTKNGSIEIIHNYGHGGSGITIGWGCAHEVVQLLEDALSDISLKQFMSHL